MATINVSNRERRREHNRRYYAAHRESLIQKMKAHSRAHYLRNREAILKHQREYQEGRKDFIKQWAKGYYRQNKARISERNKKWDKNNPKSAAARGAKYRRLHSSKLVAKARAWERRNPDKARLIRLAAHKRRRSCRNGAAGSYTRKEWLQKCELYGWKCRYCGVELSEDTATPDHAISLSRNGTNFISNILPSCFPCNRRKHKKTLFEFLDLIK